jgi:uncharacterized protein YjiS (DUF1127 family)
VKVCHMKANSLNTLTPMAGTEARSILLSWMLGIIESLRKAGSERALRRQLANLDDTLLRDIGIGEDEIWRVRAQQSFTPRAWH